MQYSKNPKKTPPSNQEELDLTSETDSNEDELFNLMFKNKSAMKKHNQKKFFKEKARIKKDSKNNQQIDTGL